MTRVALITGGASGIGAASARALEADGCTVAVTDRHGAPWLMDVTDEAAVEACFARIEAELGPVAVLVTSAGTMISPPDRSPSIAEIPTADWERTFAVNTRGTFFPVRAWFRRRLARPVPHGRAILIASAAAQTGGMRGGADYAASKAAVLGFMKVAAREAAGFGATVNAICPGPVETPLFREMVPVGTEGHMVARIPVGRIGTPDEVAAAVRFLASEGAAYITGSTVDVNGGSRMQ